MQIWYENLKWKKGLRRSTPPFLIKPNHSCHNCWHAKTDTTLVSGFSFSSHGWCDAPTACNKLIKPLNSYCFTSCNGLLRFKNLSSVCSSPVMDSLCWWQWPDICSSTAHRPRSLSHWSIWWGRAGGCSVLTHCTDTGSGAPPVGKGQS